MLIRKNADKRILLILGLGTIALSGILQRGIARRGNSSDITDFALGLMVGIGVALVGLFIYKLGQDGRNKPTGASAG